MLEISISQHNMSINNKSNISFPKRKVKAKIFQNSDQHYKRTNRQYDERRTIDDILLCSTPTLLPPPHLPLQSMANG